jgi:uncharacterized protein with GYD domain
MPTYITLVKLTEKGVADIKHGPDRLAAAKQRARERGAEIKAYYLTMGQYDAVVITEAPNDQTALTGLLQSGSQGYIRTETMRAFTEDEYKKIVAALP